MCVCFVFFFSFPALNLVLHPPWSRAGPFTSHSEATHSNDSDDYLARGEAGPPVCTSPRLTLFRQTRERRTEARWRREPRSRWAESDDASPWRATRGDFAQV